MYDILIISNKLTEDKRNMYGNTIKQYIKHLFSKAENYNQQLYALVMK